MTKVFIGMPVYNGERFLKEAIESLRAQTYTDWKLFISDDASTDRSQIICEELAKKDPRIIYYRQEKNIGMFPNFKFTLDKADTPYFMWTAQDDVWEKDFIKICVEHMEKDKNLGLATTCMVEMDSFSRVVRELPWLSHFSGKPRFVVIARYVLQPEILGKCNLMYGLFKTDALREVWRVYPQRAVWGQDYMFALAAISRFNTKVDERMLFKKRYGGFSNPTSNDEDIRMRARQKEYEQPKNHMFPFGRFWSYFMGHMEALKGTPYRPLAALLLFIRMPRAFFIHLKERSAGKFFRKIKNSIRQTIKKNLVFFGINIFLWNKIESIKNIIRYRKIMKKNIDSILEYKRKFDYGIFVETGTYRGNMVEAMKTRFKKIYSIELSDDLYRKAKDRFVNDKHVELLKGDSGVILPELLTRIKEPAFFWLDAHYSGGITARGTIDTPIERELQAIMNHPIKEHVILIDDARHFTGTNNYPTAAMVENIARKYNRSFEMKDDNFRIYPKTTNKDE